MAGAFLVWKRKISLTLAKRMTQGVQGRSNSLNARPRNEGERMPAPAAGLRARAPAGRSVGTSLTEGRPKTDSKSCHSDTTQAGKNKFSGGGFDQLPARAGLAPSPRAWRKTAAGTPTEKTLSSYALLFLLHRSSEELPQWVGDVTVLRPSRACGKKKNRTA